MTTQTRDDRLYVLLVEDHQVLRDVLQEYIGLLDTVRKCGTAPDGESALEEMRTEVPDFVLVDLSLPGRTGIELIREFKRAHPRLPMAILSGHRSQKYAREALAAGADGYLLKGEMDEIERGIASICAGRRYVSEGLSPDE